MAAPASRDPAPGMEELNNAGRGMIGGLHALTGRWCAFFPMQRPTERHVFLPPEHVLSEKAAKTAYAAAAREFSASVAPLPNEWTAVLDLSNRLGAPEHLDRRLVSTLPESYAKVGGVLPVEPPDLACQHAFAAAVHAAARGRDAGFAVHCNHGCNRTFGEVCAFLAHAEPQLTLARVDELVALFAKARDAVPDASACAPVGVYEYSALLELYRRCFFMPADLPFPPANPMYANDEGDALNHQLPALPPRLRPRLVPGATAEYAEACLGALVPQPRTSLPERARRSGPRSTPLLRIGTHHEALTGPVVRPDLVAEVRRLMREATRREGSGIVSFMPREITNPAVLSVSHKVSAKADGVRAYLVFSLVGAFLVLRTGEVRGFAVTRPPGYAEAVLDGELLDMGGARFYAFDLLLVRKADSDPSSDFSLMDLPFDKRAEKLWDLLTCQEHAIRNMCNHPPPALGPRRWSARLPAPLRLQAARLHYKRFFCLCYAPLLMEATEQVLPLEDARRRAGGAAARLQGLCRLCGQEPVPPSEAERLRAGRGAAWVRDADGLVFYLTAGGTGDVLKAKPVQMQNADFVLKDGELFYSDGTELVRMANATVRGVPEELHADEYARIAEFRLVSVAGARDGDLVAAAAAGAAFACGNPPCTVWDFVCLREDKVDANTPPVVQNTIVARVANAWAGPLLEHIAVLCGLRLVRA